MGVAAPTENQAPNVRPVPFDQGLPPGLRLVAEQALQGFDGGELAHAWD